MSWSIQLIGKPSAIVKALREQSEKLSGQSKEEYEAALPNLIGLIELNHNEQENCGALELAASGHAWYENEKLKYSQCYVSLKGVPCLLV